MFKWVDRFCILKVSYPNRDYFKSTNQSQQAFFVHLEKADSRMYEESK